ncbi:hypothetical protein G6F60_014560 [Rhizopus arrhizus]|nr:hypothetical protein G6F60_014560 [Rhizopus arrhizus]
MEQSHAQRVFQPGNALAGGRGGDALQAPGLDEAAGVGGVHEGLQVGEVVQDGHGRAGDESGRVEGRAGGGRRRPRNTVVRGRVVGGCGLAVPAMMPIADCTVHDARSGNRLFARRRAA